jgi:hypothetical protein
VGRERAICQVNEGKLESSCERGFFQRIRKGRRYLGQEERLEGQ